MSSDRKSGSAGTPASFNNFVMLPASTKAGINDRLLRARWFLKYPRIACKFSGSASTHQPFQPWDSNRAVLFCNPSPTPISTNCLLVVPMRLKISPMMPSSPFCENNWASWLVNRFGSAYFG